MTGFYQLGENAPLLRNSSRSKAHSHSPRANAYNKFTGWVDVPLSHRGRQEAMQAAQKLSAYRIDLRSYALTDHYDNAKRKQFPPRFLE